ncbi:unnamed protein product [Arctia plantaginis]|uniref:ABC transporter domain-containing protein n=1 Tax=Arctia plantaginis TaxID=874455 RepID=A0A8S0YW75_ARCPL|nr:unnamed protein product [Arctia plantaginis]
MGSRQLPANSNNTPPQDPSPGSSRETSAPQESADRSKEDPVKSPTSRTIKICNVSPARATEAIKTLRQKLTTGLNKLWTHKNTVLFKKYFLDAWLKFRLLMWKNFLQQWRRPMQTVAEILLPVITMSLVLLIRGQVPPTHRDESTYPLMNAYSLQFALKVLSGMNEILIIAYSPKSPVLEEVILSATRTLLLENKYFFPAALIASYSQSTSQIRAFNNSEHLSGLYKKEITTREILAAVEFDDRLYGATELPKSNLSYSIRFPERPRLNSFYGVGGRHWRTDLVFPSFELPGPRFPFSWEGGNDPGYVNELFIPLQHAISMELISKMTGQNMRSLYTINIERYPHPPYWEDQSLSVLKILFPMFILLSCSYTAINIVRAIVVEKELQLKETMKIMGLPTWLHWTAWFCKQFIFQLVIAIVMIIFLKVHWFTNEEGYDNYAAFTHTPWSVLFFFLLLYLCCMIFFCFMMSGFFSKGSSAALFTGVIWFLSYMPAYLLTSEIDISTTAQIFSCLIVNTAMAFGFQLLLSHECTGGLQWGQFMSSPATESSRFMFGHVVLMLFVNCVLYMLVTLYLEQVSPGPFGAPRPWYFPIQSEFWCPARKSGLKTTAEPNVAENVTERRSKLPVPPKLAKFFASIHQVYQSILTKISKDTTHHNITDYEVIHEKDPENHTIGVRLENLTKAYGDQIAVNNLNLNIYNDQITVLLGHNGAGKTTTISMLTGNTEATFGTVNVVGYDMSTQAANARSHIDLRTDIDTLIKKLELEPKRDYPSKGLSGGQKRRLCVGIALSGQAKVVLLDEPTSGMDPASRRGLWELLQKEKYGRSIILTTHFMDEADILGDRVAILAQGKLQCVGTPFFLKRHYGVGYSLVVVKDDGFDTERCTALIDKYIPGTVVKEDRGSEVTYSLPNEFSNKFENMLNDLERNAESIKFKNYGLSATTLEDVFMTVGADLAPVTVNKKTETADRCPTPASTASANTDEAYTNEIDRALAQLDKPESSVKGNDLIKQRVRAVWLKLILVWSRSWWHVLLQFMAPIILLNVSLGILQYILSLVPTIKKRLLTLSSGYHETETLLSYDGDSASIQAAEAYKNIFESSKVKGMKLTTIGNTPIQEYYLKRTNDPMVMASLRHTLLIGSTFTENTVTAHFSNFGYHDVAVSLAAVHMALLKAYIPDAKLTVYNHPMKANYEDQTDLQMMISLISMQLSTGIGSSVAAMTAVYIMFYIKERVSGAKLLQKSSGLQPAVMWGSAAVFDWIWFLFISLPIIISCASFDIAGLSTAADLSRLFLCMILYGAASTPLTYLLSNVFNGPALGFVSYFFLNVLLGMLGSQVVETLMSPELKTRATAENMDSILQMYPLYSLVTSIRYMNQIGLRKRSCFQMCNYYEVFYPTFKCNMKELCKLDESCCISENEQFKWGEPGILRYLVLLMMTCVLFWVLLMVVEYGILKRILTRKKEPPALDQSLLDNDVIAESERAHNVYNSNRADQALFAVDLTKYYKTYLAVNQISFCVNDGECFGLLGVNGAGKTSTFKMLMGEETISSGEAFVSGHSVEKTIYKVHENIGYCPQFDALFMELTGRETLRVFALMRGFRVPSVASVPEVFARALGFHKHLDKKVYQYSGGTRRKLNTAVAFLGKTRLIFVDEPTTGVDPAAKRHVWRAVRGVQRAGRGIVLTSHSMEECEALCSRLTIMVNGRFQCIGTPQHLKIKFSQGFTLTIKLKLKIDENTTRDSATRVKEYVNSNFNNPRLMEEYQDMLTYYLPDRSIPWSQMFGIMERAKQDLNIEDYSIAQTTLEQIFLQFTKYQGQEHEHEVKTDKLSDTTQKRDQGTRDKKHDQPGPSQNTSNR